MNCLLVKSDGELVNLVTTWLEICNRCFQASPLLGQKAAKTMTEVRREGRSILDLTMELFTLSAIADTFFFLFDQLSEEANYHLITADLDSLVALSSKTDRFIAGCHCSGSPQWKKYPPRHQWRFFVQSHGRAKFLGRTKLAP